MQGADHVALAVGIVIPGGEDRRSSIAQAGPPRGDGCRKGLVEHGKFLRQGRGLGGLVAVGVLCRGLGGRGHRGRRVGPRVPFVRVDTDGTQPLVRDARHDPGAVLILAPAEADMLPRGVDLGEQVVLDEAAEHRVAGRGRQAYGRAGKAHTVLCGGAEDHALGVRKLGHCGGLRFRMPVIGPYCREPRRAEAGRGGAGVVQASAGTVSALLPQRNRSSGVWELAEEVRPDANGLQAGALESGHSSVPCRRNRPSV